MSSGVYRQDVRNVALCGETAWEVGSTEAHCVYRHPHSNLCQALSSPSMPTALTTVQGGGVQSCLQVLVKLSTAAQHGSTRL